MCAECIDKAGHVIVDMDKPFHLGTMGGRRSEISWRGIGILIGTGMGIGAGRINLSPGRDRMQEPYGGRMYGTGTRTVVAGLYK